MKTSVKFLVVPLAIGALFFAGCGSDDSSDDSSTNETTPQSQPAENTTATQGSSQVLNIAADPSGALAYETTEYTTKPGKVTIDFTNESPVGHDVVVNDPAGKEVARTDVITGQSTTTEFTAKPGAYTFYCSLPGHEAAGMKGTIDVK